MEPSNKIILFNFPESVFGRRVVRYLNLRQLPFSQIRVPPNMPRPILERLGINYRRIPIMALGRDIYIDSRLILRKLETMYPKGKLGTKKPWERGFEDMLESFIIDGGPFWRTSGCIPVTAPFINDKVWMQDRYDGSGGAFTRDALLENRSWCLSQLRIYFGMLDNMLADGRQWIFGLDGPTLAEIHAGWVYDWALNMATDMRDSDDQSMADINTALNQKDFPKVHAWICRFRHTTLEASKRNPGAGEMQEGEEAEDDVVRRISASSFTEPDDLKFEADDILGLKKGQKVSIAPVDFGFTHKDVGRLVGLTKDDVAIEVNAPEVLRLHYPRINVKILPVE